MNRRLIFFLVTAVLALSAAMLVRTALKSKEARIQALQQSTVRIVVAARALGPGDTVDSAALRLVSWPREHVPLGALTELQSAVGKIVKNSLSANQPVAAGVLLEPEKTGGVLPLIIPDGMRAMSIAVDEVSDMAGFILPHSRVDVVVSGTPSGGANSGGANGGPGSASAPEISKIVLQNVEVLAVEQTLEAGPDQPHAAKVVTLLVTPAQAERLAAASRLGTLRLAMRNFADQKEILTGGVTATALVGKAAVEPLPQAAALQPDHHPVDGRPLVRRPPGKIVEVIRNGKDHQTINFLADGRVRPSSTDNAAPALSSMPNLAGPEPPPPAR